MIRLRSAFMALAALLVLSVSAAADDRADIQAVFDKLGKAFMNKDVDAIAALGTPDFTYKHAHGQVEKMAGMLAQLKKEFAAGAAVTKWDSRILNLKISGNTAVVKNSTESTMTMKEPDNKLHTYTSKSLSNDTLVKTPGGWKFKKVEVLKDHMTRDGKPFNPMEMMQSPPKPRKK